MSNRFIKNLFIDRFGSLNHLSKKIKKSCGRSFGKIVSRNKFSGSRKKIRIVDYYRSLWNIPAIVIKFDYDCTKKISIILISYPQGILTYINNISGVKFGSIIFSSSIIDKNFIKPGNSTFIGNIPYHSKINNLEIKPFKGSQYLRSSGCFGKIMKKNLLYCWIKLKSNNFIKISNLCFASIGSIKTIKYNLNKYKKAGISYFYGKKPNVRGVAKNPIDHPHGGGEGKKSGKSISMSPWGKLIKGKKTSSKK